MDRPCRLDLTDGIGGREAIDQPGLKVGVRLKVSFQRIIRIGGVPVEGCRIKFCVQ